MQPAPLLALAAIAVLTACPPPRQQRDAGAGTAKRSTTPPRRASPDAQVPAAQASKRRRPDGDGLKLYISADLEGVAGVVTNEQLGPSGFEWERFRKFMTAEVTAAIEAAYDSGATEIMVGDSHGNGQNLLLELLPPDVTVVRSWPRPLLMMQGIDESFDGAIYIGYHTGTTNPEGVRAHTMSSARFADVQLNGTSMSEAGINAVIAGHFGVPIIMVFGDDAVVAETQALLGDVEGAVVKWAYDFHSARTMTPLAAREEIAAKVKAAIARIDQFKPYRIDEPITLDLRFKNYRPSQMLAYLPIIERTDAHSIRYQGKDITEVAKVLEFIVKYDSEMSP